MLLDSRYRISHGVSRLWRGVTLTVVLSLACCLTMVTFHPVPSAAENPTGDATSALKRATVDESNTTTSAGVGAQSPSLLGSIRINLLGGRREGNYHG